MTAKPRKPTPETHKREFKARFRRHVFGWKSQPAITRTKQAVGEIKKVAKKDPVLSAEGAVAFLERVSPALEHVDSSSGSIGSAVNYAIATLVPIIASAPADAKKRDLRGNPPVVGDDRGGLHALRPPGGGAHVSSRQRD